MPYEAELQAALHAAALAGRAVAEAYTHFLQIPDAPADIHTKADSEAQEIILQSLRAAFPDDGLCAEEETPTLAGAKHTGPRLWVVDPIDGTRGFARKNGEFSVMIAFVHDGRPAVGVVLEPAKDRLTYAAHGGGCWRLDGGAKEPVRCQVGPADTLSAATLVQSRSRDPGVPSGQVEALKPAHVIEVYSAGVKLVLVARGEADIYVNRYQAFHDWDICAGHVLVAEAGGTVTGLLGEELHYGTEGAWQRSGLLATNGKLHVAAVEKLKTVSRK
jgi:3'(2'), 5'-bisphosphate nucleotidase